MKCEIMRRSIACLPRPPTLLNLFLGCAFFSLSGCGPKNAGESIKGPATAEQAARLIDLSTFPLVEGAKPPWPRGVASLSYAAPGEVKKAYEFHRKKLTAEGWKELPNSSVTAQAASGMFSRNGFVVSVSVYPAGDPGSLRIALQNHGNIKPGQLPIPSGVKSVYVGDSAAMYVTEAAVPATADSVRKLLLAQSWVPYGAAGDSTWFKQNAIRINATVSAAPAQGGKTMISYSSELMSADIPAPLDAEELRYTDQNQELRFETAADKNAVVAYYRKTLATVKWEPTLDHTVQIDDKDEMIFRNPAKDMLTLAMPHDSRGKLFVAVRFQSAAEIAELDRQIKAEAPRLKAAFEAKRAEEAEQETARVAEANKPLPKVAVTLPADAKGVEQSKDEIKFTVGNGKAKAAAESLRKQFRDAGWKEDLATLDPMAGALSFSKEKQSLTINYTDTGVMPAEITLSAMSAELERR
jgi:hypothetical protein